MDRRAVAAPPPSPRRVRFRTPEEEWLLGTVQALLRGVLVLAGLPIALPLRLALLGERLGAQAAGVYMGLLQVRVYEPWKRRRCCWNACPPAARRLPPLPPPRLPDATVRHGAPCPAPQGLAYAAAALAHLLLSRGGLHRLLFGAERPARLLSVPVPGTPPRHADASAGGCFGGARGHEALPAFLGVHPHTHLWCVLGAAGKRQPSAAAPTAAQPVASPSPACPADRLPSDALHAAIAAALEVAGPAAEPAVPQPRTPPVVGASAPPAADGVAAPPAEEPPAPGAAQGGHAMARRRQPSDLPPLKVGEADGSLWAVPCERLLLWGRPAARAAATLAVLPSQRPATLVPRALPPAGGAAAGRL